MGLAHFISHHILTYKQPNEKQRVRKLCLKGAIKLKVWVRKGYSYYIRSRTTCESGLKQEVSGSMSHQERKRVWGDQSGKRASYLRIEVLKVSKLCFFKYIVPQMICLSTSQFKTDLETLLTNKTNHNLVRVLIDNYEKRRVCLNNR